MLEWVLPDHITSEQAKVIMSKVAKVDEYAHLSITYSIFYIEDEADEVIWADVMKASPTQVIRKAKGE